MIRIPHVEMSEEEINCRREEMELRQKENLDVAEKAQVAKVDATEKYQKFLQYGKIWLGGDKVRVYVDTDKVFPMIVTEDENSNNKRRMLWNEIDGTYIDCVSGKVVSRSSKVAARLQKIIEDKK